MAITVNYGPSLAYPLVAGYLGGYSQTATEQQRLALQRQQLQNQAAEAWQTSQIRQEQMAARQEEAEAARRAARENIGLRFEGRAGLAEQAGDIQTRRDAQRQQDALARLNLRGEDQFERQQEITARAFGLQRGVNYQADKKLQSAVLGKLITDYENEINDQESYAPGQTNDLRKAVHKLRGIQSDMSLDVASKNAAVQKVTDFIASLPVPPKPKTAQERFDQSTAYWMDPNTGHKYPVVYGKNGPQIVPAAIKADTDREIAEKKAETERIKAADKAQKDEEAATEAHRRELEKLYQDVDKRAQALFEKTDKDKEGVPSKRYSTYDAAWNAAYDEFAPRERRLNIQEARRKAGKASKPYVPPGEPQAMGPTPGDNPQVDAQKAMASINDWLGPMAEGRTA